MARPKINDDTTRARLLAEAAAVVGSGGAAALSVRRLAEAAGTSTMAVYSLFGGMGQLLNELYRQAFASFGASQEAVPPSGDPLAYLLALGEAYRAWGLENPQLYGIMFGGTLHGAEPDPADLAASAATIEPLVRGVRRAMEAGALAPGDVQTVTMAIWGTVHGLVSLELLGMTGEPNAGDCAAEHTRDPGALYRAALKALVRGWGAVRS